MLPFYFLAFGPPAIGYFFFSRRRHKKKQAVLSMILFFAGFLFMVACRDFSIGIDNVNYRTIFETLQNKGWQKFADTLDIELGFTYLNKAIAVVSVEYQVFVMVVAAISIIPVAIMYIKESESSFLTILLFLNIGIFSIYFSALRQVIAMAFIVPVYYFTKHKKLIPFILSVIAAMLFHQSAFVMFVFYPIYHAKITAKKLLFIFPAVIVAYFFNSQIFSLLIGIMGGKYEEIYGDVESTGAITMIALFAIFVIYSYFIADEDKLDADTIGLRNLLIICLIFQLFAPVNSVAMRMNYYFLPFLPITIPKMANRCKSNYSQLAWLSVGVIIGFFAIYFIYNMYTGADILRIFPYMTFWE